MYKRFLILLAVLSLLLPLGTSLFADPSDEATIGGQDSSGYYRWRVTLDGDLIPGATSGTDIGTTANPVEEIHATTIYLADQYSAQGKSASIEYGSGSVTISLTYGLISKTIGTGYEVITVPDGSYAGQTITIMVEADGGGWLRVAPTTTTAFTGVAMSDALDQVTLRWISSAYGWIIVGHYGVTID